MSTYTIVVLILIGVFAGMLGGMVGVGGGIVIVPALVYFLGFSQHQAQGTSLGVIVLPVAILAVINYYQKGFVDVKTSLMVACGFVIGSYFGSKFAVQVSDIVLKRVFGTLLLFMAIKLFYETYKQPS